MTMTLSPIEEERLRLKILGQIKTVINDLDLEILTPLNDPDFKEFMTINDFREYVLNFPLTFKPEYIDLLIKCYENGKYVNNLRFVNDVIETDAFTMSTQLIRTTALETGKKFSPQYEELARYLHEASLDLRFVLSDVDRNNNGKVTQQQFCRCLNKFPSAMIVCRQAMDKKTKLIDYRQLQADLDSIDLTFISTIIDSPIINIPDSLIKFIEVSRSNGINLQDTFIKIASKSGFAEPQRFFTLMRTLKTNLNADEIKEITQFFTKEGKVDIKRFLKICENYKPKPPVVEEPKIDPEDVKNQIFDLLIDRRVNLWSVFKPYDVAGKGIVPKNMFMSVLRGYNFDIDPNIIDMFVDMFSNEENLIDYVDLAKQIYAKRGISFDDTLDSTLQKISDFLVEKNLRLDRKLAVYDREKSGLITVSQFIAALHRIGYQLQEGDLARIREAYEDKNTKHYLNWRAISADVDVVPLAQVPITNSSLQFSPSMRDVLTSSRAMSTYTGFAGNSGEMPTEDRPVPDDLIPLYGMIYKRETDFGFDIAQDLIFRDKIKKGRVSVHTFKAALNTLHLQVAPDLLEELTQFYTMPTTGDVYYIAFLKDVEEFGQLAMGGTGFEEEEVVTEVKEEEHVIPNRTMRDSMSALKVEGTSEKILEDLKDNCARKQINPQELFLDFDKRRTGTVTTDDLPRALHNAGVRFNQCDVDALSQEFREEATGRVNYLQLVKTVNDTKLSDSALGSVPLSEEEEGLIMDAIHHIREKLACRRSSITTLFKGTPEGGMAVTDFNKKLEMTGQSIPPETYRMILRKYRSPSGLVDWKKFVDDASKARLTIF